MEQAYSAELISVGCNVTFHALDWGSKNTLAFAAHNAVAILDAESQVVYATLPGHTAKVNAVKWVRSYPTQPNPPTFLISGGTDGKIIAWKTDIHHKQWAKIVTLEAHKDSVTSVDALILPSGDIIISSTSADSTVKAWKVYKDEENQDIYKYALLDEFSFFPKMMLSTSLSILQGAEAIVISFGGMDGAIHVYVQSESKKFVKIPPLRGHSDWVDSLSFSNPFGNYTLLASSSQDTHIRLWKLESLDASNPLVQSFKAQAYNTDISSMSLSTKGTLLCVKRGETNYFYSMLLESVLQGHEDWVHSICWKPPNPESGISSPVLLSASMDRTMVIWEPDAETGIWMNTIRVGEMGGMTLGFYKCAFSPNSNQIIVNGYSGAFHLWEKVADGDRWEPKVVVSGHFGSVDDISWDTTRSFLISTSQDQTTRVFSNWNKGEKRARWYEIARPQVHGHDLNCLAVIQNKHFQYVSGADEKVLRAFFSPRTFLETLQNISGVQLPVDPELPIGAIVPPLGLSNKPVFESDLTATGLPSEAMEQLIIAEEDEEDEGGDERKFNLSMLTASVHPPFEEHLLQNTLWPESQKLYGHGNEIVCVASNNSGSLIASACKATTQAIAAIRLWDTSSWKCVGVLSSHKLTVTQLQFSPDDKYLLGISRDRHFSVYERSDESVESPYTLSSYVEAHERIIWGCAWSPSGDRFATCSRDKKVKIWKGSSKEWTVDYTFPTFPSAATSVDWCRIEASEAAEVDALSIGLEDGSISLWISQAGGFKKWHSIDELTAPVAAVKRLRWRNPITKGNETLWLACASEDNSVRLYSFKSPQSEKPEPVQ